MNKSDHTKKKNSKNIAKKWAAKEQRDTMNDESQHGVCSERVRERVHLLAVALGEVDDEAARRRQRHQRPRAGVPKL